MFGGKPRSGRLLLSAFIVLAALLLGILLGHLIPGLGRGLNIFSVIYIRAIRMIVIPLVFSSIVAGVYRLSVDTQNVVRLSLLAILWFYLSTISAAFIGILMNAAFRPGLGLDLQTIMSQPHLGHAAPINWSQFFVELIPSNIIAAMAEQKILSTLVFAALFGAALGACGAQAAAPVISLLDSVQAATFRLTSWMVRLMPISVFSTTAWIAATQNPSALVAFARLVEAIYIGFLIVAALLIFAILSMRKHALSLLGKMVEPAIVGFVTRSSEAAMPVHLEKLVEAGVPRRLVSVVVPLGYSFNLDGTALYMTLATTFLADAYRIPLTPTFLATTIVVAMFAGKGIANVASGSLVATATVLSAVGLPPEALSVIAAVDLFIDMGRAALNVFGNTAGVVFVERWFAREAPSPD